MGFTVKRVLRRVLRRGSEKGVSRRCLERPLEEYAPLGVCPTTSKDRNAPRAISMAAWTIRHPSPSWESGQTAGKIIWIAASLVSPPVLMRCMTVILFSTISAAKLRVCSSLIA